MKKIFFILLLTGVLFADTMQEGVKALKNGDYESALAYFTMAANSGDKIAQQNLGVMYKNAVGVKKDNYKAAYWFNAAASHYASNIQVSSIR